MIKQFYFKQFNLALVICLYSVYKSSSSIWPINRTLSCTTTPGQSRPENDGNEGLLHISRKLQHYWSSPSDCFMSYQRHNAGVCNSKRDAVGVFYSPSLLGCRWVLSVVTCPESGLPTLWNTMKTLWCSYTIVLKQLRFGRIPVLFYQRQQISI